MTTKVKFTMTDTFAGEANFSWKREDFSDIPSDKLYSSRYILKVLRESFDIEGAKLRKVYDTGSEACYDVIGACVRIFIEFDVDTSWASLIEESKPKTILRKKA